MKNALSTSVPFALAVLACVGAPAPLTPEEEAAAAEFEIADAPTPEHPLDVRFDSRMRLVGYDLSTQITPGQPFEITWYWRVDRHLPPGAWSLFTHLADSHNENRCNADGTRAAQHAEDCAIEAPMRDRFPAAAWREGTWLRDSETVTLPTSWHSNELRVYIGFYMSGENGETLHRLSVSAGDDDGDSRARVVTLPVGGT